MATAEVPDNIVDGYSPIKPAAASGNPTDIQAAAEALLNAENPVIHAGQGVMYGDATEELIEFAELTQIPVMTTMAGKSAFPEKHPLALGSGSGVMNRACYQFVSRADVVFGIGTSFTQHGMTMNVPSGKTLIHATNDAIDIDKNYSIDHPIIGDAKLVLRQFIDACKDILGGRSRTDGSVAEEIASVRQEWLDEWMPTPHIQPEAHHALPRDMGVHAECQFGRRNSNARLRQSARSDYAVLSGRRAANLSRLG